MLMYQFVLCNLVNNSGCVAFVNFNPTGKVSAFAEEQITVRDNATCEANCRADPTCKSYQIDTNPGETLCWIQRADNSLVEENMIQRPNVIEFVKTNCTSGKRPLLLPTIIFLLGSVGIIFGSSRDMVD